MTQVFTGTGLGLSGSSLEQLSLYGPKGTPRLGQGGASVYVNAANGNLVLKQSDGFLANAGLHLDVFQSYNSQQSGIWRFNIDTCLTFQGNLNTIGSSIQRTDEDGHQQRFTYDEHQQAYIACDDSLASIQFNGVDWTYQNNNHPRMFHYNTNGQLTCIRDHDGHVLNVTYQNGHLANITDNHHRQTITWSFTQGLLRDVIFTSDSQTVHHVHYDYDAHNRLNRLRRTGDDGSNYWIAYDYEGDSSLIGNVRQSDGVTIHMDYDAKQRIKRLIDGEGRVTTYDYLDGKTLITQGENEQWTYYYDTESRLTGLDGPEQFHALYHYDGKHLTSITQGNQRWLFRYDEAGHCIRMESPTGDVILRTFDAEHHLLSETHYQTFDGEHHPISPQTTYFTYDERGHLRFETKPDGLVTEYRYNEQGQKISGRLYQHQQTLSLTEYRYDWRGGLTEEIRYTRINEQGEGIITSDTLRAYYRYDAAGQLVEQSQITDTGLSTTHYVYDTIGRLIKRFDNQHHTITFEYDDAHCRILQTDAEGLQTLSIYDKSGLLLSTQQLDATHDFGTTTYQYDNAGRLIAKTDVNGNTNYLFYDQQGRLQATVSINGHVTEYQYDIDGHCIQTHQYQQAITVHPGDDFKTIKPQTTPQDRIHRMKYNSYGQIAYQIDASGAVIAFQYDCQGHITAKTAYATRWLPGSEFRVTPCADDRTITYYYDINQRLQAEINGEGAATSYRYDAQGHLIETRQHIHAVQTPLTGDWAHDAPMANATKDTCNYSLYNPAGLKVADIDAGGYLTEYRYDTRALLIETIKYCIPVTSPINETTTIDAIRPNPHQNDHYTHYQYNDLNQCIQENTHTGLMVTYTYNAQGLITQKTRTDRQTLDTRSQQYQYDALGRVIQHTGAQEGTTQFTYDAAGNILSKTNALNETTRFIYNAAGQLTYTISPTGAITETRYNAFQQVETTIRYSTPCFDLPPIANPLLDEITHYEYNTLGQLVNQKTGRHNSTQVTTYNAFGEQESTIQHGHTQTNYRYDRRGLLRFRTEDVGGINKHIEMQYDVFGHMIKEWNALHGETSYILNKRGERIVKYNPIEARTLIFYDAFGRVLRMDGEKNAVFTYDDTNNTFTNICETTHTTMVTQFNAFGDTLRITDHNGFTTTYQYNTQGQLIHVDAPEHTSIDYTYDAAGRLRIQHDNAEHRVYFTYDADGHVLTKTRDPDGLNITTTYIYDAIGRQLQVIEADQCTRYRYDAEGHVIETCQDPDGLHLITHFTYNTAGQLIRETRVNPQGMDYVTDYSWDALGRCITRTIDPDGLHLKTTYTYDNNDNVIQECDPNQNITHSIYDLDNHLRFRIDARGVVTENRYDRVGILIRTSTYANPVAIADHYDEATLLKLIKPDMTSDQHHFFIYNQRRLLLMSIDALGYTSLFDYDANGNLVQKRLYAIPCSVADLLKGKYPFPSDSLDRRTIRFAYDGLNRQRFKIESNERLTEFRYNAAGLLVEQIRFATPSYLNNITGPLSIDTIQAHIKPNERDEHIRYAYDKADRLVLTVSAEGAVTAFEYDAAGNRTASRQYATRLTKNELHDAHWERWIQTSPDDRTTRATFDAAGREICRISPTGQRVERCVDALGNVLSETVQYAHQTQFSYDAIGRLLSKTDAEGHTTRYTYDNDNNVTSKTTANQAQWQYRYNKANQLIEIRSPITTFSTYKNGEWHEETRAIITQNEYDSFGNLIREIHDVDGIHQIIQYTYDANQRRLQTIYPDVAIYQPNLSASNTRNEYIQTLIETNTYNAFGEITEHCDRAGHTSHVVYDELGQQVFNVNAEGCVTRYHYDAFGNLSTKITFANAIPVDQNDYSIDGIITVTPTDVLDRYEYYRYDGDHRLIEIKKNPIRMYNSDTDNYNATHDYQVLLKPTTRITYNAFGDTITQSVQLTDTNWSTTTYLYDNDGLHIATLDAEQYLTTYRYNAYGLVETETQYATRGSQPTPSSNDRSVSFLYNANGQLTQKTIKNVTVSRRVGQQYDTYTCDLTSEYRYDAMGNMVSTTDPDGNTAYSYYNAQGQLIAKVGMETSSGRAATTYRYDALGQLIERHGWAQGAQTSNDTAFTLNSASPNDIIQRDIYDTSGHIIQKIDGTGHVTQYSYDANGNVARCWQQIKKADASLLLSDKRYTYDRENRLTQTATLLSTGQRATDDAQYNTFGDVVKKGQDGIFTTQIDYDQAGRVWRSNAQGYFQIYLYDLSDHITQILTSTNAFGAEYGETGIDLLDSRYNRYLTFSDLYDFQRQNNTYDALGRLIQISRDATAGTRDKYNPSAPPRLIQTQTFDRWGNMLSQTTASGHTTYYEYNAINALTKQILPEVNAVDEHGITRRLAPVNHYAIDKLGRTIAMTDANGHTIAHQYDANGHITQDIDAQGHHRDTTYNLFGQLSTQTNERGGITTYTYDAENRLISLSNAHATERYDYDEAGQLIRQTDALGNVQTMTYDELGHLIEKTAQHNTTRFEYDNAGHKTAEQDANGNTSTWRYNKLGYLTEHTDFGGHRTQYTYNRNGLKLTETSNTGKSIVYHYYNDGKIQQFVDNYHLDVVNMTYDKDGNIASKLTSRPGDWALENDYYEYDALNRIQRISRLRPDNSSPDRIMLSVDYDYDAVGNIRDTRTHANYTGRQVTTHSDYYRYDENNRIIVNKGQLVNGEINITHDQGSQLAYDATGNISDSYTFEYNGLQHYAFRYNTNNLLEIARKNDHDIHTKRYEAGLLKEETLYNDDGEARQHNTLEYHNGRLSHQITKDVNQVVVSDTSYAYDNVGNIRQLITHGDHYTETHEYDYERWDSYLEKNDHVTLDVTGRATSHGISTHQYDVNGLLQAVDNPQAFNNKTYYYTNALDGIRSRKDQDGQTSYFSVGDQIIGDLHIDQKNNQRVNVYSVSTLPDAQQDHLGSYTIKAGDTLEFIALHIYGDSGLWYLIADANGITQRHDRAGERASQLHIGARLNIPSINKDKPNTDRTSNSNAVTTLTPAPPPHKHHHNSFWKTMAQIAIAVTSAVAMVLSAGALATLALGTSLSGVGLGSLITTGLSALNGTAGLGMASTLVVSFAAGFTSSIAGQTAANLLHQQNGIDMKGALLSGLATAATAGVGHLLSTSSEYAAFQHAIQKSSPPAFNVISATEMMERDAITQSLNLALIRHQHFDWLELGVSAATAGIMGSTTAQTMSNELEEKLGHLSNFATSELQALATGAATGHFDVTQILQDNLGNAISSALLQPSKPMQDEKLSTSSTTTEDLESMPTPDVQDSALERLQRESKIRQHLDQLTGQFLNEINSNETFNPGAALGIIGNAVYGNGEQISVGHGALKVKQSETYLSSVDSNKNNSQNHFNFKDAENGLKTVYDHYGPEMTKIIEKMYRFETRHFTSVQYQLTGTPGMEAPPDAKAPYYGWAPEFFKAHPEYAPIGTTGLHDSTGISNQGGNKQKEGIVQYVKFSSVEAGMMHLAYRIKNVYKGNIALWHSRNDASAQKAYNLHLKNVRWDITQQLIKGPK